MNTKITNKIFFWIITLSIIVFSFIMCVLCVSFYNESQGKSLELWAKDYASLISALGIFLASSIAAISVQRTINNSVNIEDNKSKDLKNKEIADTMKVLHSVAHTLRYYEELISNKEILNNEKSDNLTSEALVIFNEIYTLMSLGLNNVLKMSTPNIDKDKVDELVDTIFKTQQNLIKIKITSKLITETNKINDSYLEKLINLMKSTEENIYSLSNKDKGL